MPWFNLPILCKRWEKTESRDGRDEYVLELPDGTRLSVVVTELPRVDSSGSDGKAKARAAKAGVSAR